MFLFTLKFMHSAPSWHVTATPCGGTRCCARRHVAVYGNSFTSTRVQTCSVSRTVHLGTWMFACPQPWASQTRTASPCLCFHQHMRGCFQTKDPSSDDDSHLHPPRRGSGRRAGLLLTVRLLWEEKSYNNIKKEKKSKADATHSGFYDLRKIWFWGKFTQEAAEHGCLGWVFICFFFCFLFFVLRL